MGTTHSRNITASLRIRTSGWTLRWLPESTSNQDAGNTGNYVRSTVQYKETREPHVSVFLRGKGKIRETQDAGSDDFNRLSS